MLCGGQIMMRASLFAFDYRRIEYIEIHVQLLQNKHACTRENGEEWDVRISSNSFHLLNSRASFCLNFHIG